MGLFYKRKFDKHGISRAIDSEILVAYVGIAIIFLSLAIFSFFIVYRVELPNSFSWGITFLGLGGLGLCVFGLVRVEYLERTLTETEADEFAWMRRGQKEGVEDEAF